MLFDFLLKKKPNYNGLILQIEGDVYARTMWLLEYTNQVYETDINLDDFVFSIYDKFLDRAMFFSSTSKIMEQFQEWEQYEPLDIEIVDYTQKVISMEAAQTKKKTVTVYIEETHLRKGQYLLSEINESYNTQYTLAQFILFLWKDFVRHFQSDKKEDKVKRLKNLIMRHTK